MAWEHRHGRLFYYRKVREGNRIRSVYMGNGESALQCSDEIQATHQRQQQERVKRETENALEKQLDALDVEIAAITKNTLTTAGFHQHKGTWRKKRH